MNIIIIQHFLKVNTIYYKITVHILSLITKNSRRTRKLATAEWII